VPTRLRSYLPTSRYWTEVHYHPAYRATYTASDIGQSTVSSSLQSNLPSFRYWTEVQCPLDYIATYPASDTGHTVGTVTSSLQSYLPSFRYWTEVHYHPAYRATYPASDTGQRFSNLQPTELLTQLQILDRGTVTSSLQSYFPSFRYWTEVQ
jgi:hypothetical protein